MRLRGLGVLVLFAAVAVFAPSALATDYYADVAGGSWTNTSTWHTGSNSGPVASAYPGQNAGDRAIMDFQGETITLASALANAVELQENCVSCFVNVQSGGSLPLTTGSVSAGAILQITGGTVSVNSGQFLTVASGSSISWSSGTLGGAGTTSIASGAALNATGNPMAVTGNHAISLAGTLTYGASANNLSIGSGSNVTINSGGTFDVQNSNGIAGSGTINVMSGGTFIKTNGNFGTNITPTLNNASGGTVQTNINDLVITGGNHQGSFVMNGASTGIGFSNSPTFLTGTIISGTGTASLSNVTVSGTVSATNLSMDSFGSITGGGTLNVSGTFDWKGGTIQGATTVNMASGSTLNYTGQSNATLTGSAHINMQAFSGASTFNVFNIGLPTLSINNGGHVTNAGTMNLVGDVTINSDGTNNARIDNSSVITKNSGASFADLKVRVNNSGSVSTTSGSVKLSNGGTHAGGSFSILVSGGAIAFAGGTHQFTGTASMNASPSGTFGLTAGVMDVDTNITVGSTATFQQSGGTLTGSGAFTVPGPFLWTAGTEDNSSGNGQTVVSGSTAQIAPSPSATLSGRTLSMSGTMTYNGSAGSLAINSGAIFQNSAGTFNYAGDASFNSDGVSSPTFRNLGTINKSAGSGTSTFACRFDGNGGTINLSGGVFQMNGGGTDLGTVNFGGSSNKIIINAGTFTLANAPTLTGGGVIVVQNTGTLGLATAVTIPNLDLLGGTISGGTLGVSNLLTWQGGTMSGGVTNIANTATVDATAPTSTLTLSTHSLTNNGIFNWNGTSQSLVLTNGSSLINNGTFNATGAGNITSPSGVNAITNNGTFKKTGGAGGTRIDPAFANGGTLSSEVSGQSLIINGGGSQSGGGMMNTNAGAFLDFFGGTFTVSAGTSPFNGSGIYRVNGGTLAIAGNMSLSSPASLIVSSGALDVAGSQTFQVSSFTWNGGTLQNNGTTRVFGGSIGNTAATTLTNNHTLTIPAASFNYNADNVQFLSINGTANLNVESSAAMYITANGVIGGTSTDGVTVSGTLSKTGSGVARIDVPLTINTGVPPVSFGATGGTLQINGGGSSNNTAILDTALSAIVNFSGGTFDLGPSTTVNGTGTIAVSGGTLNVNGNLTFPQLQLSGGALSGVGAMSVNAGSWTGGSMTGTGSTTVPSTKSFTISTGTGKTLARNLGNSGTLSINDGFTITGAATLSNTSQINVGAVTVACGVSCTGGVSNLAAGNVSTTGGSSTFNVPFNNAGTVSSTTGSMSLLAGGTHSGDFTAGANITFGGTHSFASTSDLTGAGSYTFNGTSTLGGTYTAGTTSFSTGSATAFNTTSAASLGSANLAGDVNGSAALTLPGGSNSTWTNGMIGGASTLTIASGGTLTIGGAGARTLDGRSIISNGTLFISGPIASGLGGGAITNLGGFRAIPTAPITVSPAFSNGNLAEFMSSSVAFNGGYTQTAGTTKLSGGSFSSLFTVNIDAGSVIGTGTITANVANDGTFAPGLSPGTITVAGNYTQSGTGVVSAEIGGNTPGSGYDQLVVTGTATLAGTLSATFINSFLPADGDTFDLVTWGTRSGTFTTVNLPAYNLGTLTTSYEPNSFRITTDTVGDLAISKTGPPTAAFGSNVSFTITVTNNGPSPSNGVTITDPTPANLTFVSNGGDCTGSFPCAIASIPNGATKTITSTYTVTGGAGSNITNTASVSSTSTDNVSGNNTSSATVFVELSDLAITKTGPIKAKPGDDITFTITVANGGASAAQNVIVNDPTPTGLTFLGNSGDCTTAFPCSLGTMASGTTKTILAKYSISGSLAGSTVTNSATVSTTTTDDTANNTANATVVVECLNSAPDNLTPTGTAGGTGTLSWRGSGSSYIVYFGPAGTGCSTQYATTTSRSVSYSDLAPGTYEFRVESLDPNCRTFSSACVTFIVPANCNVPAAPLPRVVGQATSAKTYSVEWDAVLGAVRYDIEEADNADFIGNTRLTLTGTSQAYKHDVTQPTAFYYRVRAYVDCMTTPGPYSPTVRVVIIPLPTTNTPRKSVNVPAGSQEVIVQEVFIPGEAGQNLFFSATTDRPWLTVRPAAGVITPGGINLEVVADPRNLPNGTFTASVIVTITTSANGPSVNGNTTTTVPISVNLVTPVTPVSAKPSASQYALIIPSAGHLDGIDSHWQSDIRVTNAGFKSARYRLTFTPSGGTAQGVKQTEITIDAGATTALDDVISNWFGLGTLGDGANGMLEILPLDDPANTALTTVASSRTYNVSGNGTLGQYIPAVPFPSFIGKALPGALPKVLSLQQIAQNAQYRTNVGLAEASGFPVNAVVSIFNASGAKLKDIPVNLAAGEQRQMNQLLADNGIELSDGRIEVKVTGGDGKVTAYASVVDSASQDPLLVSGQPLSGSASKYVLAGVANLNTGIANWQTDMRVFNFGTSSQPATLTFYPFNNGPSKSVNVLVGANQVMTLDNLLKSQFDVENQGGVVHLSTPQPASLVVTGRTYNQTANGTYGQFVPAVTTDQAVGVGGRTLHILQVEDSTRYRTNIGLSEVTGKPAVVELQVVLPDSKITPTVQVPLAANEFRQFNPIRELGVGNVYNARITVRVLSGDGRVTAYGSVIDEVTQDPTYVPAQ